MVTVSAVLIGSTVAIFLTLRSASTATDAMAKGRYDLARDFYATTAEDGNPDALNALGNLHYLGLGGQTDYRQAAQLYFNAAAQGHAGAQLNLAHLFKQGFGVNTDLMRAYAWYRMSDISGSPWAEYYITQTALEYTLSPMQMATANEQYPRLRMLVDAGLR